MDGFGLQLPTIQNWDCHSCSDCCSRHIVEITTEERQTILDQGWSDDDEFTEGTPILVRDQGSFWNRRWRLGQRPDGACVFLDEQGLCRIHAKFGEPTKPLACRVYPYAFHPQGKQVTVSLRFSCPSVVENRGRPVTDQRETLKAMARESVPANVTAALAPGIKTAGDLDWITFRQFSMALEKMSGAVITYWGLPAMAPSWAPVASTAVVAVPLFWSLSCKLATSPGSVEATKTAMWSVISCAVRTSFHNRTSAIWPPKNQVPSLLPSTRSPMPGT